MSSTRQLLRALMTKTSALANAPGSDAQGTMDTLMNMNGGQVPRSPELPQSVSSLGTQFVENLPRGQTGTAEEMEAAKAGPSLSTQLVANIPGGKARAVQDMEVGGARPALPPDKKGWMDQAGAVAGKAGDWLKQPGNAGKAALGVGAAAGAAGLLYWLLKKNHSSNRRPAMA